MEVVSWRSRNTCVFWTKRLAVRAVLGCSHSHYPFYGITFGDSVRGIRTLLALQEMKSHVCLSMHLQMLSSWCWKHRCIKIRTKTVWWQPVEEVLLETVFLDGQLFCSKRKRKYTWNRAELHKKPRNTISHSPTPMQVLWTRYSGNINRILKKYLLLWGCQVKRRVKLQL